MSFWVQLKLLIWKNFLIRKRQKIRLCIEMVWPLLLFLILMWVRTRGLRSYIRECHFDEKALPSAGPIPFLQSFYCTFSNPCHSTVRNNKLPTLNTTLLLSVVSDLEFILKQNIYENQVDSFKQVEGDFYHILQYVTDVSQSANVEDYVNIGNALSTSPDSVFSRHNMTFSFDTYDVLKSASVSFSHVFKNLLSSSTRSLKRLFCDDIFTSVIASHYKIQLDQIRDSVCSLPLHQLSSLLIDVVKLFSVQSLTKELSRVLEEQTGKGLNVYAWQTVFDLFANLSNKALHLDIVRGMMKDSSLGIDQAVVNFRTNPDQFMNNIICGRDVTFTNRTETVTNGFARLDEMGRKFHFTVSVTEPTDEHDNTTSQACKELFLGFGKDPFFKILWKQMKPFVRGKILYTPNTAATRAIMQKVNESFAVIQDISALTDEWLENISPDLQNQLIVSETLEFWRNITDSKVIKDSQFLTQAWKLFFSLRNNSNLEKSDIDGDVIISELHEYFLNVTLEKWLAGIEKVDDVVHTLNQLVKCFDMNKMEPLETEDEAVARGVELIAVDRLWAVIVFENLNTNSTSSSSGSLLPPHVYYKIRMDADKVDSTKRVEDRIPSPGSRSNPIIDLKYITFGFVYLQDLIEHAIIQLQTGAEALPGYWVQQFPYPCYIYDQFILAISRTFPMFMVLSWVYTSAMIIKTVVHEKEKRLKEVMKVMGLGNTVHWLGWFVNSFVLMLVTVALLTLLLKYGDILHHSDVSLIFIFLTLYTMATITKSFLISTFFSKANIAAATGGIIFFVLYLPYPFLVIWEEEIHGHEKAVLSVLSNVAFGFGCSYLAHYEESGIGLQWYNLHVSPLLGDTYSMSKCMYMLIFDCILYSLLTWYIEAVAPGQYGVPKPFYFPFTRAYWLSNDHSSVYFSVPQDDVEMRSQILGPNFEKEPAHLPIGVSIQHLRKVYINGKVAVDDLSLNFYEDQITSFLGHNGAGKTTTISILTGLFPPTSGTAHIYGMDICANMDLIRKSLGTCPQHNVLFDHLTVEEHLWFYGCLKGRMKDKVANEVDKMIHDIGLPHKRNEISRNLSGGMQRKLSVAIAFVGGSRTVILDEPTAGVDPYSRRAIWELLLKYKKNRTIILTTHHMDEADLLGDRIAIISCGTVRCCGSSLFLKRRFGNGYYLTLVRSDDNWTSPSLEERQAQFAAEVTSFVSSFIPSAKLVENVGMELVYVLPIESKEGGTFELLFDALDKSLQTLGIASYGISDSTLEEIFLKVASEDSPEECQGHSQTGYPKAVGNSRPRSSINTILKLQSGGRVATVPFNKGPLTDGAVNDSTEHVEMNGHLMEEEQCPPKCEPSSSSKRPTTYNAVTGWALIRKQIFAIHVKRFHHTSRDIKGLFCEIILPALFVCLALIFTLILPPFRMELPLHLHPWLYGPPNFVFFSNDNPTDAVASRYEDTLVGRPGLGTRCMSDSPIINHPCRPSFYQRRWNSTYNTPFTGVIPCTCDVGAQVCPTNAGGPMPPSLTSDTTDVLMNLTARNISDWLVKTEKQYYKKRFGGVTFGIRNPLTSVNISLIHHIFDRLSKAANLGRPVMTDSQYVFSEFDKGMREMPIFGHLKVWFNNKGWAAMVSYVNAISNVVLRAHLPPGRDPSLYGITAINHPLNFTSEQVQSEVLRRSGISLLHAICVIFAMSFVPASFVLYLIEDRVSKSQHLQFVTGVKPITYWIANNIWDNVNYLISATLCIIIFLMFDEEAYVSSTNFPGLVLLLVLYGWASIPMMYPASFLFNIPSTAFVVLASGNLFVGVVSTIATFILEVLDDQELQDIADILKQVFLIFPHYCLGRGLMDMATNHLAVESLQKFGVTVDRYPLSWEFLGKNLLCMAIQGIIFFSFTLLLQYKFFVFFLGTNGSIPAQLQNEELEEDDDVARERALLLTQTTNTSVLKLVNLTKVYRIWGRRETCYRRQSPRLNTWLQNQLLAVDRVCFQVRAGECFGLLGVNGAGKTTTFKMLTKDTSISNGDAYVNSYSIRTQMDDARRHIGYCPQFDALDSLLTGEEHLYFYARLRGIPDNHARMVVNEQLSKLSLNDYSRKCAGTYSGGNKRKLSTAIALIGNPSLVLLDEPTTGMDPQARRFLWNCISELMKDGRSVILTSHSLEECEALCTRLAIMVNGRLQCLGSIQHLKNKFGSGYSLTVRVGNNPEDLELVKTFIVESFPTAKVLEEHHNQLVFQLPPEGIALSRLFHQMEEHKSRLRIEDYSVCQTTLDQVFINFAKKQIHLMEDE